MARAYTNEQLRKNNRAMEHIAIMAFRDRFFEGEHYRTFDTKEEQLLGDAVFQEFAYVEVKHRDERVLEDYLSGKDEIHCHFTKKWKKMAKDSEKNLFYFVNSFPQRGVMLVHRFCKEAISEAYRRNSKFYLKVGYQPDGDHHYIDGKGVDAPVNDWFDSSWAIIEDVHYTPVHLDKWMETRRILKDGGSIFEEDERKHLAPNDDTSKSEIDMAIEKKRAHLALLEANRDDIKATIKDLKDDIAILESAKKVMDNA